MAAERGGLDSMTGRAPRLGAISSTASSGDTTQVSHPGTVRVASRTSSSMASVSAARSSGERRGASRLLVRASDFTGIAITRTLRGYRGGERGVAAQRDEVELIRLLHAPGGSGPAAGALTIREELALR